MATKRRHLARDLVTLVRVFDRLDQAQTLLNDAFNILDDDRLKLPQLDIVRARIELARNAAAAAVDPFDDAFADEGETKGGLLEFSKEYGEMTATSYKGGRGEVD